MLRAFVVHMQSEKVVIWGEKSSFHTSPMAERNGCACWIVRFGKLQKLSKAALPIPKLWKCSGSGVLDNGSDL